MPPIGEKMSIHSCFQIANYFIEKAKQECKDLTHMQVQKLVYIAHGWKLAVKGEPLFYEEIYAWPYGPVIPDLFHRLKGYKKQPIKDPISHQSIMDASLTDEEKAILDKVWQDYSGYSGEELSAKTHIKNSPWWLTKYSDSPSLVIGDDVIKGYYKDLLGIK